jgi:hypothetical protein
VRKITIYHFSYIMTPLKVGTLGRYFGVTRQAGRRKERMIEPEDDVHLEEVTTSVTDSIIPSKVEEETLTTT